MIRNRSASVTNSSAGQFRSLRMCQSQRREVPSKHAFSLHQAVCFRFSHEHSAGRVGRYLITGHEIASPGCVSVRRKNGNGNLSHRLAGIPLSFHNRRSRELMMPGNPHRGARRKRQRGKVPSKLPAFLTALPVSIVFAEFFVFKSAVW